MASRFLLICDFIQRKPESLTFLVGLGEGTLPSGTEKPWLVVMPAYSGWVRSVSTLWGLAGCGVGVPAQPLISSVVLGTFLHLPEPRFPPL